MSKSKIEQLRAAADSGTITLADTHGGPRHGFLERGTNEYGTRVSIHLCWACNGVFSVCPAAPRIPPGNPWGGCLAVGCPSYDPARDADKLFDEEPWRVGNEAS